MYACTAYNTDMKVQGERQCMCIFHETFFALSWIRKGYLNRFSVSFK